MNEEMKEAVEGIKPPCLMCDNKDYGWYEVMRDNCGKSPQETLDSLCDVHQDILKEQLQNEVSKK